MLKRMIAAGAILSLMLSAVSCPAFAGMDLRIANKTPFELIRLTVEAKGQGGETRSSVLTNTLPDEICAIKDDTADSLKRIQIDLGLATIDFTDCAPLTGKQDIAVSLALDDNNLPFLELEKIGSNIRVKGAFTDLLAGENVAAVAFQDLLAAGSMADVRRLAGEAVRVDADGRSLIMPVALGTDFWVGTVTPASATTPQTEYAEDKARPESITLRIDYGSGQLEGGLLDFVYGAGFRPFSLYAPNGKHLRFYMKNDPDAAQDADAARSQFLALLTDLKPDDDTPGKLAGLIVHEATYDEIASGLGKAENFEQAVAELTPAPGFTVRLSNSLMLEFIYEADCRASILQETRSTN